MTGLALPLHGALLGFHITVGAVALALGPPALLLAQPLGRQTRLGLAYGGAVLAVCVSALGLAALDWPALWWLTFFAVGTAAAVLGGWRIAGTRPSGWPGWYVRLMCGSYIALITALLVVSWGSLLAWVLPTVVGAPVVETTAFRVDRRPTQVR